MAGRCLGFILSFLIPVVLIRLLDQTAFGTYKQFFLIGGTLAGVLTLGMDATLFYFIPRDPRRAANYLINSLLISLALGCLAGAALWLLREAVAGLFGAPALAGLIAPLAAYLILELAGQYLERLLVIEKQARLAALYLAASDGLRAASLLLPALLTEELFWVAIGAVLYAAVRFVGLCVWALWQYRDRFREFSFSLAGEQVEYGLPFGAAHFVNSGTQNFHQFYVASLFDPATYAIYAVGCLQISPVKIFFRSLFEVALVRMTEHFASNDLEAARDLWAKLIRKQAVFVVPLVVVLWMLAEPFIVGVFTADYAAAVPVFRAYVFLVLLTMLNDHSVLRACAETRFIFLANVAALLVTLVLVPLLTWQFALVGAAVGLVSGIATMKGIGLVRVTRHLRIPLYRVLPWGPISRILAGSVLAAAVVYPFTTLVSQPLLEFFGCGAAFWAAYLVIAWIGSLITSDEKQLILRWLRSVPRAARATGP